jgi:hypothetical protein
LACAALVFKPAQPVRGPCARGTDATEKNCARPITERDVAFSGSRNPIARAARPRRREARQYSGRAGGAEWRLPVSMRGRARRRIELTMTQVSRQRSGVAFDVRAGQRLRVIDPEGEQVADPAGLRARRSVREALSSVEASTTRVSIFPGHRRRAVLQPERVIAAHRRRRRRPTHDFPAHALFGGDVPHLYGEAHVHRGCFGNFAEALRPGASGRTRSRWRFNVFMNVGASTGETGKLARRPAARAAPGDAHRVRGGDGPGRRADRVCSAGQSNNFRSLQPIHYEVLDGAADAMRRPAARDDARPWRAFARRRSAGSSAAQWLNLVPMVAQWIWLSLRHRQRHPALLANPGITPAAWSAKASSKYFAHDGAVGARCHRDQPSACRNVPRTDVAAVRARMAQAGLAYPVVAKPDLGWCGFGVRKLDGRCRALWPIPARVPARRGHRRAALAPGQRRSRPVLPARTRGRRGGRCSASCCATRTSVTGTGRDTLVRPGRRRPAAAPHHAQRLHDCRFDAAVAFSRRRRGA